MTDLRALVRTPLLRDSPLSPYRGNATARRSHHPHSVLISDGPDENFIAVFGPLQMSEFLTLTDEFFGAQGFEVVIESDTAAGVEADLVAAGWSCVEEEIAMALTPLPQAPAPPPGLRVETVAASAAYDDYMRVTPGNRAWVPNLAAATDPNVALFVGYTAGVPVTTARLTCYGDVAEITGVQTLPAYRRRGYGRALTWAAISEAAARACRAVTLTASEMGYPLYLQMGFQEVCNYRAYERPQMNGADVTEG